MLFAIGMTLAPRKNATYNEVIRSIRAAGFTETIIVFAEPGEYLFTDNNVQLFKNTEVLGCLSNFNNAMYGLMDRAADAIMIVQDDFIFSENSRADIESAIFGGGKVACLYADYRLHKNIESYGWQNIVMGDKARGSCYAMMTADAYSIIHSDDYKDIIRRKKNGKGSDLCFSKTCSLLSISTLYHNPSIVRHIGGTSTLAHEDNVVIDNTFFHKYIPKRKPRKIKKRGKSHIIFGMASIPEREHFLKKTIESVYDQADEIHVALNNYESVPKFLVGRKKIKTYLLDNAYGAGAKFLKVGEKRGYYFSIDDDLWYPEDYTERMIKAIEKYKRKCIIGVHGTIILKNPYTKPKDLKRIYYYEDLHQDTKVHMTGTGVTAFHTDTIDVSVDDFLINGNESDMVLASLCKRQGIDCYVVEHDKGWVKNLDTEFKTPALWKKQKRDKRVEWFNELIL